MFQYENGTQYVAETVRSENVCIEDVQASKTGTVFYLIVNEKCLRCS